MPRRAAPGNEAAILAVLTDQHRTALEDAQEILNIWNWQLSPLAPIYQQVAVTLLAARMIAAGEVSEKDAVDQAALTLGLSPDTARSRARRWPVESRSLCTPTRAAPPRSLGGEKDPDPFKEVA